MYMYMKMIENAYVKETLWKSLSLAGLEKQSNKLRC